MEKRELVLRAEEAAARGAQAMDADEDEDEDEQVCSHAVGLITVPGSSPRGVPHPGGQDFMHGFTAVFGIATATQSAVCRATGCKFIFL